MTYEQYEKEGHLITKEEYVQIQKDNLDKKIKDEKKKSNKSLFLDLSIASVVTLITYPIAEVMLTNELSNNFTLPEKLFVFVPSTMYISLAAITRYLYNRKIKKLRSTEIVFPTNEEINDHNLKAYHLSEAAKIKVLEKK